MANDLTVRALGVTVEYRPTEDLQVNAVGVETEFRGNKLAVRSLGAVVEYSEATRSLKVQSAGLTVEYADTPRAIYVRSLGASVEYIPKTLVETPPTPEVVEPLVDANGVQTYLSPVLFDIRYIEVRQSRFANPDKTFTGYAADGFWYTAGVPDPTHVPFKATWASEGEGDPDSNRSNLDRFPDRIFVVTTFEEVVILDADDLTVWMRFRRAAGLASGSGYFAGDAATEVRKSDFDNGVLCLATNQGLRVADFVNDTAYLLKQAAASKAVTGLADRNTAAYLDATPLLGQRTLASDECLHVSVTTLSTVSGGAKNDIVVAAVGHLGGITGVRLRFPGQTHPETLEHDFVKLYGQWHAVDDNDGDGTTNLFTDDGPTAWRLQGVRPGDIIKTSLGAEFKIVDVRLDALVIDQEIDFNAGSSFYRIYRAVRVVDTTPAGGLVFANGENAVTRVDSEGWYDGSPIDAFDPGFETSTLQTNTGQIRGFAQDGRNLYVATDVGVYYVSEAAFAAAAAAELRYSIEGQTSPAASYAILHGTYPVAEALALDPETGQLLIACTDTSLNTVLTEVNPRIHQAFRFFTRADRVTALVGFRNTEGPPHREVG